ncbi:MAG: hypothetical protein U1D26_02120, partial [Patescibacteria group bacterium]|nr:hypothetical protein [Patescibacteria group bacterium]
GDEFRRFIYGGDYTTPQKAVWNLHKRRIEAALARGEKVPPEVLADYPDLAKQVVTPTPQPRGSYSSRIRWCNTKPDDQGKVLAWRPLRDLIYIGVGYQVAVEVCEAGFGGGQFQVTIGYPVEGGPRKGHLTSQQLQALRQQAKSFGRLAHEVLTKDTGLLVWDVTLPGPEDTDLALKVQLPGRERDERPSRKQEEAMQPAMFSQTFLDTVLHTALGTAVSIGVAKAMSASVIPPSAPSEPALYVIDEEAEAKKKAEREEAAKRKAASASVLSPSYVEGDQAQVDVGTLLQEIDEILKHPETMGIVDSTTLRIIRG